MVLRPDSALNAVYFGAFLVLQYFFVNKSQVAAASFPPRLWVPSLLEHADVPETRPTPAGMKGIKGWLAMLHEYGLVAPPCGSDKQSMTVRLRLRTQFMDKMARIESSLHVNTQGLVTCVVSPRDYIALARYFGDDDPPGRQELGMRFSRSFTRAFGVYAGGGDKLAVAEALGLAQCPLDVTRTYRFLVLRYVVPVIGIILIAGYALNRIL
jgi:hypothetical protein